MEGIIVAIIVVGIATMLVTTPNATQSIRTLFAYFAGAFSATLGTK